MAIDDGENPGNESADEAGELATVESINEADKEIGGLIVAANKTLERIEKTLDGTQTLPCTILEFPSTIPTE
jgi:hypothetical protein